MKIVESKNDNIENSQNLKVSNFQRAIFIALNVILVGVSTWATYIGYKSYGGLIAAAIAAVVGILYVGLNFEILNRRVNSTKHLGLIIMYFIPLGISFVANFSTFYSRQIKYEILKNDTKSYLSHITTTKDEAVAKIERRANLSDFEKDFSSMWNKVDIEFNSAPGGWGPKCRERWSELVDFLREKGSSINAGDVGKGNDSQLFNRAKKLAENERENIVKTIENDKNPTLTYITDKFESLRDTVNSLANQNPPKYEEKYLDLMAGNEKDIRSRTTSFLNVNEAEVFSLDALKPSNLDELGTIKTSLYYAFTKKYNLTAALVAIIFSLIIDLAALLYILVFIPYNRIRTAKAKGRINGPQRI